MLKLLVWVVKWGGRLLTLIRLKNKGWKWFAAGVFMMFVVPPLLRSCF